MTYLRTIEDSHGDLIDLEWYCSAACYRDHTGEDPCGHLYPCPEQADYPQYCPSCGAVAVPALQPEGLTDDGAAYIVQHGAEYFERAVDAS